MSTKYDKAVIQQFADALYSKANSLQISVGFLGFCGGLIAGGAADTDGLSIFLFGLGGLVLGYYVGTNMGLSYRMEAQKALCLVQIEENTRNGSLTPETKQEPLTVKGAER